MLWSTKKELVEQKKKEKNCCLSTSQCLSPFRRHSGHKTATECSQKRKTIEKKKKTNFLAQVESFPCQEATRPKDTLRTFIPAGCSR